MTRSAAQRYAIPSTEKSGKKVIALRLDEREKAALAFLGGLPGLKALLCPEGLCIRCRSRESLQGTRWDSFCGSCDSSDPTE